MFDLKSVDADKQETENLVIDPFFCFPTAVYITKFPKFLPVAKEVCNENISKRKEEIKNLNEIYPVIMTDNLIGDMRLLDMENCIGQTACNILDSQGYDMKNYATYFTEFWCQEHHKHSGMEQHVHGGGSQIVGFYFVDVPKESSRVMFHDPKAGKVQLGLRQSNASQITPASDTINFVPEEGMCIFTNSWLPHSFSRHASKVPMRFIHFNISIKDNPSPTACHAPTDVEVI